MVARKKAALKIYELHVELEDIEPIIWRRILVPAKITLPKLHHLLQLVMGWTDSHLHSFEIGDRTFGMDGTDLEELNMLNEKKYMLDAVLGDSIREFVYDYDFGDSWRHRIKVTPITNPRPIGAIRCALPGRAPHRRTTSAVSPDISSSCPLSKIRSTKSTLACWSGSAAPSTQRASI